MQVYELRVPAALAEVKAWRRVRPRYAAQEHLRLAIAEEHERAEGLREELAQEGARLEAARVQREAMLKQARHGLTSTARPTVLPYPPCCYSHPMLLTPHATPPCCSGAARARCHDGGAQAAAGGLA